MFAIFLLDDTPVILKSGMLTTSFDLASGNWVMWGSVQRGDMSPRLPGAAMSRQSFIPTSNQRIFDSKKVKYGQP